WTGRTRYTTAFGQGYSVNALQMVSAVGTFANDGVRIEPSLISGIREDDGSVRPLGQPESTRVVSSETAATMRAMMDNSVDDETSSAKVDGYAVGGKTGTAQVGDGTYTASFIGFAPADDPELVVGVFVFGLNSFISGSRAAAPAFSELTTFALQNQGIAPTGVPGRELRTGGEPTMTSMTDPALEPARPRRAVGASAAELARALGAPAPTVPGDGAETVLRGVTLDSRSVERGDLWCALPGANAHGAQFAEQAAALGAAMALTDAEGRERCESAGLPSLVVEDPRRATAAAAALVQGRPAERLATIGVTGTNGKTSITTAIARTLDELAIPAGAIGTSGTSYRDAQGADHAIGTVRTTPEAPELHGLLARRVEAAVEVVSMEVSSHALVLHRADEVVYDVACFTNLTQDHLDFHGTMEE